MESEQNQSKPEAKTVRARCLRDTVQDNPFYYFYAGREYIVRTDSPVLVHFEILEEVKA